MNPWAIKNFLQKYGLSAVVKRIRGKKESKLAQIKAHLISGPFIGIIGHGYNQKNRITSLCKALFFVHYISIR